MVALAESISPEANNYHNSFKIIEHLIQLNQTKDDVGGGGGLNQMDARIIGLFESVVVDNLNNPKLTFEYLMGFFDCLNYVMARSSIQQLENSAQALRIAEKLLDCCVSTEMNSIYSNTKLIIKISLVIKEIVLK
jgi:hypothetical protein